jgi:hypothetical protein
VTLLPDRRKNLAVRESRFLKNAPGPKNNPLPTWAAAMPQVPSFHLAAREVHKVHKPLSSAPDNSYFPRAE